VVAFNRKPWSPWTGARTLEAMKALLWLNGGSAAALLTLFGGTRPRPITPYFGYSITSFAVGAAFSVGLFVWAYPISLWR
jgi:hypothetical protein